MNKYYQPIPNQSANLIDGRDKKYFREKYKIPYNMVNRLPEFSVNIPFEVPKSLLTNEDDEYNGELPYDITSYLDALINANFLSHFCEHEENTQGRPSAKLVEYGVVKVLYGPGDFTVKIKIKKVNSKRGQDYFYPLLRFVQDISYMMTSSNSNPHRSFGLNGRIWVEIPTPPRGWGASPLDYRNVNGDFVEPK